MSNEDRDKSSGGDSETMGVISPDPRIVVSAIAVEPPDPKLAAEEGTPSTSSVRFILKDDGWYQSVNGGTESKYDPQSPIEVNTTIDGSKGVAELVNVTVVDETNTFTAAEAFTRQILDGNEAEFSLAAAAGDSFEFTLDRARWMMLGGANTAEDVGIGCDGTLWIIIGTQGIYQWNGSEFVPVIGAATRIAVGNSANIAVVNMRGNVYRWTGSGWQQLGNNGIASDVGIGADGTLWIIGTQGDSSDSSDSSGNKIYQWKGSQFVSVIGAATRIAVGNSANIAVVNMHGNVYRWTGSGWQQLGNNGIASDVGIGADGTLWITGRQSVGRRGNQILRWNGSAFVPVYGRATSIAVGSSHHIAVVNELGAVFQTV